MTYLRIMDKPFALSKYLQTSGLVFINAFKTAAATINDIKQIYCNFCMIVTQTDYFVKHANVIFYYHGCNIIIESSFSPKRIRKNKNEILDIDFTDLLKKFKVDAHDKLWI